MTSSAVAARYANALADVVTHSGSSMRVADALVQLRAFESVLKESPELHEVLLTPAVPGGRKKAVVGRLAELLKLSAIMRNFLFVLLDHRRIPLLGEIISAFEDAMDQRLGFARADVLSARELTDPQRVAITAQ